LAHPFDWTSRRCCSTRRAHCPALRRRGHHPHRHRVGLRRRSPSRAAPRTLRRSCCPSQCCTPRSRDCRRGHNTRPRHRTRTLARGVVRRALEIEARCRRVREQLPIGPVPCVYARVRPRGRDQHLRPPLVVDHPHVVADRESTTIASHPHRVGGRIERRPGSSCRRWARRTREERAREEAGEDETDDAQESRICPTARESRAPCQPSIVAP
jgi:hypothetical protein